MAFLKVDSLRLKELQVVIRGEKAGMIRCLKNSDFQKKLPRGRAHEVLIK